MGIHMLRGCQQNICCLIGNYVLLIVILKKTILSILHSMTKKLDIDVN